MVDPRASAASLADLLLRATFFLLPWIGIGLGQLLLGRSLGTGAQPALVTGGAALLCLPFLLEGTIDRDGERVLMLLAWTLLGLGALWTLDEMGLGGEQPWSKGLKQGLQLAYFLGLAALPTLVLSRTRDVRATLRGWERTASAGMLLASVVGLYFAAAYALDLPARQLLARVLGSNPSIASGSDELYLGHRFVGIARVRSGAAEPLFFGSYLLCVLPVTLLGWLSSRAGGRWWRGLALATGLACAVLTFSRGVYLGLALWIVLVAVAMGRGLLPRPGRRTVVLAGVVLLLGAGGLAALLSGTAVWALPALMLRRMEQSFAHDDLSNLTRLASWRAAFRLFLEHPLQGVGWGGFGFWYYRSGGSGMAAFSWPVTNSLPLRILAETGSVGALLWGLALVRPLSPLRALFGHRPGGAFPVPVPGPHGIAPAGTRLVVPFGVSLILAATVAAMLLQLLTFSQINLPHLWLTAGVSAALARMNHREGS